MVKNKSNTIYYVVDNKGWVQRQRLRYLAKYIPSYNFKAISIEKLRFLWTLGFLRRKYIFFSTWRIAHALIKKNPNIFSDLDHRYLMAAVTSHSNIGGGLDPLNPIPGRKPEEAFNLAVGLLKKFKVVSANSLILYEMLKKALPNLFYCPNGMDTDFFTPKENKEYNPECIKIGWVGKIRGPKNFSVIEKAFEKLESIGGFKSDMVVVPKDFKRVPFTPKQMLEFYRNIDFYLCASWNEGTPNPALEAGACGVPVVTTRVGNMRELIRHGENGFFIEPTTESIIAQFKKIKDMGRDVYYKMSNNIHNSIVQDWSWEKRIQNFSSCFDKLVY